MRIYDAHGAVWWMGGGGRALMRPPICTLWAVCDVQGDMLDSIAERSLISFESVPRMSRERLHRRDFMSGRKEMLSDSGPVHSTPSTI